MSVGTMDGVRVLHDLLTQAKARPEMADTLPGGLAQLVAGVQDALGGKTARPDLHARVQRLKQWIEAHPAHVDA